MAVNRQTIKAGIPEYRASARFSLPKNPSYTYVTPKQKFTPFLPTSDDYFHVFKRLSIALKPLNGLEETERKDVVRATPSNGENNSKDRFDTVMVHDTDDAETMGVKGYRVAQVRAIFILPEHYPLRTPLAYVEYFTPFTTQRKDVDLYAVKRSFVAGRRESAVVSIESIRCSCHLIPIFGNPVDPSWNSDNVLEVCESFFVNPYLDVETFQMMT